MLYSLTTPKDTIVNIKEHRFKTLPDNTCLQEDKDKNTIQTILALK